MTVGEDLIRRYYDKRADEEWGRLDRNRMEFAIIQRLLSRHLPPRGRVLDCGGGPGRYALWLADRGYDVTLFDLSAACLEKARREAGAADLTLSFEQGTATDLTRFLDASFDVILLMGPLYHLKELAKRQAALAEAARVLRPGGLLAATFITRAAPLRDVARRQPSQVLDLYEPMLNVLRQGYDPTFPPPDDDHFHAYFAHWSEIEPLLRGAGFHSLGLFAAQGFVSMIDDGINDLHGPEWDAWVELNLMLADDPGLFSAVEHLLALGKRR